MKSQSDRDSNVYRTTCKESYILPTTSISYNISTAFKSDCSLVIYYSYRSSNYLVITVWYITTLTSIPTTSSLQQYEGTRGSPIRASSPRQSNLQLPDTSPPPLSSLITTSNRGNFSQEARVWNYFPMTHDHHVLHALKLSLYNAIIKVNPSLSSL